MWKPTAPNAVLALFVAALVLPWCIVFASLAATGQNFPLNDDWAYAAGAFAFARGEGAHYMGWSSAPLLGQWVWASPFLWIFGASHVALRVSTILLSWLGILAFFDLLRREAGLSPCHAALTAAALALHPLFFLLAGTFMSDVPALAFSLVALALYSRGMDGRRWVLGASGAAFAILAAVSRQNTFTVAIAAAALLWGKADLRRRLGWWLAILLPLGACVATGWWMNRRTDVVILRAQVPDPVNVLFMPYVALHTVGLAVLPLLVLYPKGRLRIFGVALGGMAVAALYWKVIKGEDGLFPYLGNMLTAFGAFEGDTLVVGPRPVLLGSVGRWVLTVAGCVGGAGLLARLVDQRGGISRSVLLPAFTLLHLPILLVSPQLFDRYFLVLMPGALCSAVIGAPEVGFRRLSAAVVALAGCGALSVALMHDWLAWNSARWALGRRALARGILASDIEGGFEWDGWYANRIQEAEQRHRRGLVLRSNRLIFPDVAGRYALAFSAPPPTRLVDAEPYDLWLLPGRRRFFLIELPAGAQSSEWEPPGG